MRIQLAVLALGACGLGILLGAAPQLAELPPNSGSSAGRDFTQPAREILVGGRITKDRAFFGAPPPVPHSILSDRSSKDCLECHALQDRVAQRHQAIAPVPHSEFSQCMQCHVKGTDTREGLFRENSFVGLDYPGKGSRAHDFAPPTIPHKTWMRENCLSCHGLAGNFAIRTPHPVRSQCRQCHAAEASQDYTRPTE